MRKLVIAFALSVAATSAHEAGAQSDYPNRPVRVIVDSAPGSATDVTMRVDPTGKLNWAVSFAAAGAMGVGNGVKLDAAGTSLYMGGGQQLPGADAGADFRLPALDVARDAGVEVRRLVGLEGGRQRHLAARRALGPDHVDLSWMAGEK